MNGNPRNIEELQATFSAAATNGVLLDTHMTTNSKRGDFTALTLIFDQKRISKSQVEKFGRVLQENMPLQKAFGISDMEFGDERDKPHKQQSCYEITTDNHTIQLRFYPSPQDDRAMQRLEWVAQPADSILKQNYINDPYAGLIRAAARITGNRIEDFSTVYGKERAIFREKIAPDVSAFRDKILTANPSRLSLEEIKRGSLLLDQALQEDHKALLEEPQTTPAPPPLTDAEQAFLEDAKQMRNVGVIIAHNAAKKMPPGRNRPSSGPRER